MSLPNFDPMFVALTVEQQLLLSCSRIQPNADRCDRIRRLMTQPIDWPVFIEHAKRHGVIPQVYLSLRQVEADVPSMAELKQIYLAQANMGLLLAHELAQILKLFQSHKLDVLPFKGPVLATSAYGNLSSRKMSDLDLLIRSEEDEVAVLQVLQERGYQSDTPLPWELHLYRDPVYCIDLHRDLVPRYMYQPLCNQDIWDTLELEQFGGYPLSRLPPYMQLLMLCLNGTKDCWQQLNRICDIAELIQRQPIEWSVALTQYKAWGFGRLVSTGLYLAQTLLEAELPPQVNDWVQANQPPTKLVDSIYERLFTLEYQDFIGELKCCFFHIRSRERYIDKIRAFLAFANRSGGLTPTQFDRRWLTLPESLSFLYYLLRPIRVFFKYSSDIFKLVQNSFPSFS